MSQTTKLRDGWVAISDGFKLTDESEITFKNVLLGHEYNLKYHVLLDFFADQIGCHLEDKIDNLDMVDILSVLINK